MATERALPSTEQPLGSGRRRGDMVFAALVAGLLWGMVEALRIGAGPLLSIAAAASVSGLLLGTWHCLKSLDWLRGAGQAAIWGAWIAVGPLSVFGSMLAASTHHRPLGAATFAVVASLAVISCVTLTLRGFALTRGTVWEPRVRVLTGTLGVVSLAFGLWRAHLAAAVIVGVGALRLALWLVPKLALVERWRGARVAARITFGTLCVAAIWLASEPMTQSSVSIPLGLWSLALQK